MCQPEIIPTCALTAAKKYAAEPYRWALVPRPQKGVMIAFVDTLVLRRKEKKLSQSELAKVAGVSRNYISQIERGKIDNVSYIVFDRICIALELSFFLGVEKYENFQDFARPTPRALDAATPSQAGALCPHCNNPVVLVAPETPRQ